MKGVLLCRREADRRHDRDSAKRDRRDSREPSRRRGSESGREAGEITEDRPGRGEYKRQKTEHKPRCAPPPSMALSTQVSGDCFLGDLGIFLGGGQTEKFVH